MNDRSRELLFGDDSSPCADRAWLWINAQAWPGFEARVLTCETEPIDLTSDETLPVRHWEPTNPRRAAPEAMFEQVTHLHSTADPRALLPTLTPDLLVIGPCGKRLLRRLTLGSTAETMMAHSMAPLVIARGTHKAQTIAVCIDGSQTSLAGARFLSTLPLFHHAERVFVVGVKAVNEPAGDPSMPLSKVAEELGNGSETRMLVSETPPAEAIANFIKDERCDLVVVGRSGRGALERALVGSTTTSLARSAPIPVMIIPPA
jgi:nucleotide-binding universal stress UspA family protein